MNVRSLGVQLTLVLSLLVGACGSAAPSEGADPGATSATEVDPPAPATAAPETTGEAHDAATQDVVSIDWATVDLNTVDWDKIDVSQIDMQALQENPTAPDLDPETITLIQAGMSSGNATLIIGDESWELDSFGCAFGHEATSSDVYSFSSNSFGEHEGAGIQMQANIRDQTGQGRFEGEDLRYELFVNDVDDFENPSIDWDMAATDTFRIEGDTVTVEGTFDDKLTADAEAVPGSLQATCGAQSRR